MWQGVYLILHSVTSFGPKNVQENVLLSVQVNIFLFLHSTPVDNVLIDLWNQFWPPKLLQYWLFSIALRSTTCWQQFTVSPASNEWLKHKVSMNFPVDTSLSSYVWSVIKNSWMTISSVKSLSYYYSCQEQLSPFLVLTSESLLMSIVPFVYKPV